MFFVRELSTKFNATVSNLIIKQATTRARQFKSDRHKSLVSHILGHSGRGD